MALSRTTDHDWSKPDKDGTVQCGRCDELHNVLWQGDPPEGPCRGLSRSSSLSTVSDDRERKREDRGLDTDFKAWVKHQPCIVHGHSDHQCRGDVVPHHVKHKAHAGDWVPQPDGGKVGNLIPVCAGAAHVEVHNAGKKTFAARYGLDPLEVEAVRYGLIYKREEGQ